MFVLTTATASAATSAAAAATAAATAAAACPGYATCAARDAALAAANQPYWENAAPYAMASYYSSASLSIEVLAKSTPMANGINYTITGLQNLSWNASTNRITGSPTTDNSPYYINIIAADAVVLTRSINATLNFAVTQAPGNQPSWNMMNNPPTAAASYPVNSQMSINALATADPPGNNITYSVSGNATG